MYMPDTFQLRQRWLRSFPDGSLEFLLVTRLLALFLLLTLAVMRESQRAMVLVVLGMVLAVDYALMVWWAIQARADLDGLAKRAEVPPAVAATTSPEGSATLEYARAMSPAPDDRAHLARTLLLACLPMGAAFIALVPWPAVVFSNMVARDHASRIALIVGGIAFWPALVVGYRVLRNSRLTTPIWTALLAVPLVHWLAMHRIVGKLHHALDERRSAPGEAITEGGTVAAVIADVTWVLAILPWLVLMVAGLLSSGLGGEKFVVPCATVLTALFAIADVAAMEGVQRRLVKAIRRPAAQV